VSVVPGDYDAAVETAAALGTSPGCLLVADTSLEGYHRIPQWIVEGYSTLFVETDVATAWPPGAGPSLVIVPVGVGSLAQSAVRHYASRIATGETVVVTVEPVDAACLLRSLKAGHPVTVPGPHTSVLTGLNCGTVSLDAWPDLLAGVGIALTVTDTAALAATEDLDRWGIPAGECGGASVAALRALAAHPVGREFLHPDCDVLVLCTEGAAATGRV
jgi:diaminopropionate ammonia-lyase